MNSFKYLPITLGLGASLGSDWIQTNYNFNLFKQLETHVCVSFIVPSDTSMFLTWGAVDAISSWFAVLTRRAMEPFIATALPTPKSSILTLPMIGAPVVNISRAFKALMAIVPGATGIILQKQTTCSFITGIFLFTAHLIFWNHSKALAVGLVYSKQVHPTCTSAMKELACYLTTHNHPKWRESL